MLRPERHRAPGLEPHDHLLGVADAQPAPGAGYAHRAEFVLLDEPGAEPAALRAVPEDDERLLAPGTQGVARLQPRGGDVSDRQGAGEDDRRVGAQNQGAASRRSRSGRVSSRSVRLVTTSRAPEPARPADEGPLRPIFKALGGRGQGERRRVPIATTIRPNRQGLVAVADGPGQRSRRPQEHRAGDPPLARAVGHSQQQDVGAVAVEQASGEAIESGRLPEMWCFLAGPADPRAVEVGDVEVVDRPDQQGHLLLGADGARRRGEGPAIPEVARAIPEAVVPGTPSAGHGRRLPGRRLESVGAEIGLDRAGRGPGRIEPLARQVGTDRGPVGVPQSPCVQGPPAGRDERGGGPAGHELGAVAAIDQADPGAGPGVELEPDAVVLQGQPGPGRGDSAGRIRPNARSQGAMAIDGHPGTWLVRGRRGASLLGTRPGSRGKARPGSRTEANFPQIIPVQ